MPLSLEEETKLLPLAEKASDLIVNLIMEEDSSSENEFKKTVEQISAISPFIYKIYLDWYNRFPKMKSRLLDWGKDNI